MLPYFLKFTLVSAFVFICHQRKRKIEDLEDQLKASEKKRVTTKKQITEATVGREESVRLGLEKCVFHKLQIFLTVSV